MRLTSGGAVAAVGLLCSWLGGLMFLALVVVVAAAMVWEICRMLGAPGVALPLAGVGGGALLIAALVPPGFALPLLILPAMMGFGQLERHRTLYTMFTVMILLAGYGLVELRGVYGFRWMAWLALVVIFTDVFGYFAGRYIGGPKFWPRVSPKKTWSGTVAGWAGALVIAVAFMIFTRAGAQILGVSVAISMASQLGDIAESAMKRRVGVKDSSHLLPGHGGVFDRFDSMLGASVFMLLASRLVDFPPVPG